MCIEGPAAAGQTGLRAGCVVWLSLYMVTGVAETFSWDWDHLRVSLFSRSFRPLYLMWPVVGGGVSARMWVVKLCVRHCAVGYGGMASIVSCLLHLARYVGSDPCGFGTGSVVRVVCGEVDTCTMYATVSRLSYPA